MEQSADDRDDDDGDSPLHSKSSVPASSPTPQAIVHASALVAVKNATGSETPAPSSSASPSATSTPTPAPATQAPGSPDQNSPKTETDVPFGVPVADKPGFVVSPFSPNGGYVDVRGLPSGVTVKDPYTGKVFRTP